MTTVVAPLALFSPGRTYSNLFLYFSSCLPPPLFNNVAISKKKSTRAPSSLSVLHTANGAATSRRLDVDVDVDVDDEEDEDGTRSENYLREDYLVKKVSAKDVHDLLKGGKTTVPLVVDFYATWCGPCILMAQDLELLAVEYETSALFVKVDTDEEHEFARNMQVRGLPTLYFFSPDPNKDAIRTEGLVPPEMIKNIIDNEM